MLLEPRHESCARQAEALSLERPDAPTLRLLNEFQHRFPLAHAPFAEIGLRLGQTQQWVVHALQRAQRQGAVSRVGAVFAPHAIGTSVLAALRVPPKDLERVAQLVSSCAEVNHNYQREHVYNLWFVATAADQRSLERRLREIELQAECDRLLVMPLLDEYRIDLGFDLAGGRGACGLPTGIRNQTPRSLSPEDKALIAALQPGLELVAHPYAVLARRAGMSETACIEFIQAWIEQGVIRRFGIIVRHRELGFRANAMVVWDVPDALVTTFGLRVASQPDVTLAYRRRRCLPQWPYNLYCMVHGRDRAAVEARIERLRGECGLSHLPSHMLFSRRCFKQRGAHYLTAELASYV